MDLSESRVLTPPPPVLALSRHPLLPSKERELFYAQFRPGETLWSYLKRTGIREKMGRQPFLLFIDGRRVPRELWRGCCPKPGTLITLVPAVRGGGGQQKNPLATIAMLALIAYSGGMASGLLGAELAGTAVGIGTLTYGGLAAGAIVLAGGMALNAIFPPPKPQLAQPGGMGDRSPTYDIAGGQNRARRYEPFPKLCGEHIVFPDLGAQSYTEFEGEDQVLFQVFDLGYNEGDCSEHKIGSTPIANFTGVQLEESGATGALTLFPGNVDTVAGAALTNAGGSVSRNSSANAEALAVEITGALFAINTASGEVQANSVRIRIEYRLVGGGAFTKLEFASDSIPESVVGGGGFAVGQARMVLAMLQQAQAVAGSGEVTLWNASRKPLRRTFRWNVAPGQYEVRVTKVSGDQTDGAAINDIVWSQLRTYQKDSADYTGRKRFALKIRASGQLTGQVEQFNLLFKQRAEVWNGAAWVPGQLTRNPAWLLRDAMKGKTIAGRRKWGAGLADADLDVEGLKAFGTWCSDNALTFDFVFDQRLSVFDMLSAIALGGRATLSRGTGKLGVVWDAPNQAYTAVFGMHNVRAGSFEIEYATEDLAEVIEGWFINKDRGWQRDFVRVPVPGAAGTAKVRRLELVGRVTQALAAEDTNLYAATNAYRTRRYKWHTDWEGLPCARGDVVILSHDLAALDHSGRLIEGGNAATLKLPKKVPLYGPGAFVVLTKPDGTSAVYNVDGGAGDTDTLTVNPALPFNPYADPDGHPCYDYRWTYGPANTPGKKVKIEKFKPVSDKVVEMHAFDERPEFYAAKGGAFTAPGASPVFGRAPVLGAVALTERGTRKGPGGAVRVEATWTVSGNYSFADVRTALDDEPLADASLELRGTTFETIVPDGSKLTVEVTAWGDLGRLGQPARQTTTQTFAWNSATDVAAAPEMPMVSGLELEGQGLFTTWKGRDAKFWWREAAMVDSYDLGAEPYGGASGARDHWFQDYLVRVYNVDANGNPTTLRREEPRGAITENRYTYSFEKNYEDGAGVPVRDFAIEVFTRGRQNQLAKYPARISVTNPQPAAPAGIIVLAGANAIAVRCTPAADTDFAGLKIHRSTVAGFAPGDANLVYDGPDAGFTFSGLAERTTYYFRLGFYDVFSKTGINYAAETAGITSFTTGAIEVLGALPAAGNLGRVVYLTTDGKLYRDSGAAWVKALDGADLIAASVTAQAIAVAQLSAISADMGALNAGTITLNLAGHIKGGQSAYNTGTGYWIGYDAGAYKFSFGNPAGNRITWDGTTLTVRGVLDGADLTPGSVAASKLSIGTLSAITADLGAITAGTVTLNSAGHIKGGQSAYNTGTGYWIGYDAGAGAYRFSFGSPTGNRITWDGTTLTVRGVLDATDITGQIAGGQIANGVITVGHHTSGTRPIEIVTSLPAAGNEGRTVYLTTDDKLYRDNGSAFIKTTDGADLIAASVTAGALNVATLAAVSADMGNLTAGTITLNSAGYLRATQTDYNTGGTGGFWGWSGGTFKMSLGNPSGNRITWDGTTLTIRGSLDGADLAGGSVPASKLSVSQLSAITADLGTITAGTITLPTTGWMKGGQTDYDTGTGFFLGYSGAAYKLSIGSPTGARLTWDGATLTVVGAVNPYTTGNFIIASADTARSEAGNVYVKKKEIVVVKDGTIKTSFRLRSLNGAASANGRVYKNGAAAGTERATGSGSFVTFEENIAVAAGDAIQLYARVQPATGSSGAEVDQFRIKVAQGTVEQVVLD